MRLPASQAVKVLLIYSTDCISDFPHAPNRFQRLPASVKMDNANDARRDEYG